MKNKSGEIFFRLGEERNVRETSAKQFIPISVRGVDKKQSMTVPWRNNGYSLLAAAYKEYQPELQDFVFSSTKYFSRDDFHLTFSNENQMLIVCLLFNEYLPTIVSTNYLGKR